MSDIDSRWCAFCKCHHPLTEEWWCFTKRKNGSIKYRCKHKLLIKRSELSQADKDRHIETVRRWRANNPERERANYNSYYARNKDHILARNSEWQKNNRDKVNARWRERMKTDVNFKLSIILRIRLNEALKNNQKAGSAVKDLGCSIEELKVYLESKFYPNPETGEVMIWDNWSRNKAGWQIDHIQAMSGFDLSNPEELKKACHYTNLQPLWNCDHLTKTKEENLRKSAK